MNKKVFFCGFVTGVSSCILTSIVSILLCFCPALNPDLYDRILFLPMHHYPDPDQGLSISGIKAKEVMFDSLDKKVKLTARLYEVPGAKQIILYTHGQGGNIAYTAYKIKFLVDSKASVLAYDFRGYGKSVGDAHIAQVNEDARAAYDYILTRTKFKSKDIILYGESLGSAITSDLASKVKSAGVVLESPFISLSKIAREKFPVLDIYPESLFPNPTLTNEPFVKGVHSPLLIVGAEKDVCTPLHHAQYLYKHASGTKFFLTCKNTNHAVYDVDPKFYCTKLAGFMDYCQNLDKNQGLAWAKSPAIVYSVP
ncbi:MAG: alpha/beta hydrolase [Candidatus Melainabacteria bacterium]|nr:alpha/beta hydrolase [Candidatus Melainabacteria bacterium]